MRRVLTVVAVLLAAVLFLLVLRSMNGDEGSYKVRAVFDNGAFVVPDVDVRVAGANVGNVDSIDVSLPGEKVSDDPSDPDQAGKAIIVLNITDPDFQDFREDASCLIRPQSLIGEKFIDCQVTQPRPPGTEPPPSLQRIPDGQPGAGEYLLPVENNGRSVDQDLINNIYRLPYAQRFRIILNELGVGLATRGEDLNETITRANPTLMEVNKVLKILSSQNRRLAELARNGDNNLTQLASRRKNIVGFFREAGYTAAATAERSADQRENLRNLPTTLRELRSSFRALDTFATDARPVFAALRPSASKISELTSKLKPFAEATETSITALGDATRTAGPDLVAAQPIVQKLGDQARTGEKPFTDLNFFLGSTRAADGFRNLMRFFYNTGSALNGFDEFGHYQRTNVIVTPCTEYFAGPQGFSGCWANWKFTQNALSSVIQDELTPFGESGGVAPGEAPGVTGETGETGPTGVTGEGSTGATGTEPTVPNEQPAEPAGPQALSANTGTTDTARAGSGDAEGRSTDRSRVRTRMAIMEYLLGR